MKHFPPPSSVRFPVHPRLLPPQKVARWMHLTLEEFQKLLPDLRKEGFPAACRVTGHYDFMAIEAWQNKRSGLSGGATPEDHKAIMRQRIADLG